MELGNNKSFCTHNAFERRITGVWCSVDLKLAVEHGYVVYRTFFPSERETSPNGVRYSGIYESWVWSRSSCDIFKAIVRKLIRLKLVASGIPDYCKTDVQVEQHVAQVNDLLQTSLTPDQFVYNKPMRSISKILINRYRFA